MTRGTGYLISDTYIHHHDEFNGDMYYDGHGEDFLIMLSGATKNNFKEKLNRWNKANHNYNEFNTYVDRLSKWHETIKYNVKKNQIIVDFNVSYFKYFFSDWVFFKNDSNFEIIFITVDDKKELTLSPKKSIAINFGHYDNCYYGGDKE